jgi:hypothetical protein
MKVLPDCLFGVQPSLFMLALLVHDVAGQAAAEHESEQKKRIISAWRSAINIANALKCKILTHNTLKCKNHSSKRPAV